MSKRVKSKNPWQWMYFSDSYLICALTCLKELLESKHFQKDYIEQELVYKHKQILLAILWNFKHGMEIAIKALTTKLDGFYIGIHDQNELLEDLKKMLKSHGINTKNDTSDLFYIFLKYYHLDIWNRLLINSSIIRDIQNDIFRYPDNSASMTLDFTAFKNLKDEDLKELYKDIQKFIALINKLHTQLYS